MAKCENISFQVFSKQVNEPWMVNASLVPGSSGLSLPPEQAAREWCELSLGRKQEPSHGLVVLTPLRTSKRVEI